MNKLKFMLKIITITLIFVFSLGVTKFVPNDFQTIQQAIDYSSVGDVIYIMPGVYDKSNTIFPIYLRDGITLYGYGPEATVIDATGAGTNVLKIENTASTKTQVMNLTVRGGQSPLGSGIEILNSPSVLLSDLLIEDNISTNVGSMGAGIGILNSFVVVERCSIINNQGYDGGGIGLSDFGSSIVINDSIITGNKAINFGGGIYFYGGAILQIDKTKISKNIASIGGGIYAIDSFANNNAVFLSWVAFENNLNTALRIENFEYGIIGRCLFNSNEATFGAAIYESGCSLQISENTFAYNKTIQNSPAYYTTASNTVFSNNFVFKNVANTGDIIHLQSPANTQPFIYNTIVYNENLSSGTLADRGIVYFASGSRNIINNIIAFNKGIGFVEPSSITDPIFKNNLLYNNLVGNYLDEATTLFFSETDINYGVNNSPFEPPSGNIVADPLFKDVWSDNYKIKGQSPAKDAGYSGFATIDRDWEDDPRYTVLSNIIPDIGADEITHPHIKNPVIYLDKDKSNTVNQGDILILQFDRIIQLTQPLINSYFTLPVLNDSLGTFPLFNLNTKNPSQVIITLGNNPVLTIPGYYEDGFNSPGSSSGIDIAAMPTPIPITDKEEVHAVHNGIVSGTNSNFPDIRLNVEANEISLQAGQAGQLTVGANGFITQTRIVIRSDSLIFPCRLRLRAPDNVNDTLSAVQLEVLDGYLLINPNKPIEITIQYNDGEIDSESGQTANDFRIFKYIQIAPNLWQWFYVKDAYGNPHQIDTWHKTVTCYISDIYGTAKKDFENYKAGKTPYNSNLYATQGSVVFANLPLEIISENTITIKSAKKKKNMENIKSSPPSLQPKSNCYYTLHKIEFPGYVESDTGIKVKIRKPTLSERAAFPSGSNSIFVIETTDSIIGNPVSFTDPVNITVQYKDSADSPTFKDIVYSDGASAIEAQMRVVKYDNSSASFKFINPNTDNVNRLNNVVSENSLVGLTSNGKGILGSFADINGVHFTEFDYSSDGWAFGSISGIDSTIPVSGGGFLTQIITGAQQYGAWISPWSMFPISPNKSYYMEFGMNSTIPPYRCPNIRVRAFPHNFEYSAMIVMNPRYPDGYNMPNSITNRNYGLLYTPPPAFFSESDEPKEIFAAYEIMHFNGDSSTVGPVNLDNFTLKVYNTADILSGFSSAIKYDFNAGMDNWLTATIPGLDPADIVWDAGAIKMTSHTNSCFGSTGIVVPFDVQVGKLYLIRARIKTNVADQTKVTNFRLRAGTDDQQFWGVQLYTSFGQSYFAPTTMYNDYDMYFYPEQTSILSFPSKLVLVIDILNIMNDDEPTCSLWIDSVEVLTKNWTP